MRKAPKTARVWTDERKDLFRRLWCGMVRGEDIADLMTCSLHNVWRMQSALDLPKRNRFRVVPLEDVPGFAHLVALLSRRRLDALATGDSVPRSRDVPKMRKCLKCCHDFASSHAGNRICPNCTSTNATLDTKLFRQGAV